MATAVVGAGPVIATASTTTIATAGATAECPLADGSSPKRTEFNTEPAMCTDFAKTYTATVTTSEGSFTIALDVERAPIAANNFVVLARHHAYDGTQFYRADDSVDIIEGGATSAADSIGYTIPDDADDFTYAEGDVMMSRTDEPHSAGAQFFVGGGPGVSDLEEQGTYVRFGRVTEGIDVVEKILGYASSSDPQGISTTVTIEKVDVVEGPPAPGADPNAAFCAALNETDARSNVLRSVDRDDPVAVEPALVNLRAAFDRMAAYATEPMRADAQLAADATRTLVDILDASGYDFDSVPDTEQAKIDAVLADPAYDEAGARITDFQRVNCVAESA